MVGAATTHLGMSAGGMVALLVACSLLCANGVAHYRGWHKRFLRWLPSESLFFGTAWFGAFGVLLGLADLAALASRVLAVIIAVLAVVALVVAVSSIVWLPPRLLPAWYLAWRADGRPESGLHA